MENRNKQDGIRSWYQLVNQYETKSQKRSLQQSSITIIKRGLFKWVHYQDDAFTELILLDQTTWNDDDVKKHCLVQNAQNIGIVETVFEALLSDKSLQKHATSLYHMPSEMINKPKKRVQDRFIIHTILQVISRKIRPRQFWHYLMNCKFKT